MSAPAPPSPAAWAYIKRMFYTPMPYEGVEPKAWTVRFFKHDHLQHDHSPIFECGEPDLTIAAAFDAGVAHARGARYCCEKATVAAIHCIDHGHGDLR